MLHTVTDYTRYYGLPAPAHPLLTLINLVEVREQTFPDPVVSHLYTVALKRGLKGTLRQKTVSVLAHKNGGIFGPAAATPAASPMRGKNCLIRCSH